VTRERDSFVRSAGLIAALTLLSRLLGVVRDVACAAVFGGGLVWDAFGFAFRIPNLFRRILGEGALSAAFVPVFSEYVELRRPEEASGLAGRTAGALTVVAAALVALGELIVLAVLLGAHPAPRWHLALVLTALLLPYALLVCLTALAGATLHGLKHFAAPALAPVVLNVCWIVSLLVAAPLLADDPRGRIWVVATGILLAGVLQLALQLRRWGASVSAGARCSSCSIRRCVAWRRPWPRWRWGWPRSS